MNELQIFSFEENQVRTVMIDNEPYFIGKDVAEVLGYKDTAQAIKQHVDEEDKLISNYYVSGQNRKMVVVNESGIYSLVFGASKQGKNPEVKENAKKFKRWVTSEVLPSIRKTGGYQVPTNPMQALELMFQVQKETDIKINQVANDLQNFKEDMPILGVEEGKITEIVRSTGVRCLGGKESRAYHDKSIRGKVYADIYGQLKREFGVATYKAIKRNQVDEAIRVVKNYTLPLALGNVINVVND